MFVMFVVFKRLGKKPSSFIVREYLFPKSQKISENEKTPLQLVAASTLFQHQFHPGPESRQDVLGREAGKRDPGKARPACAGHVENQLAQVDQLAQVTGERIIPTILWHAKQLWDVSILLSLCDSSRGVVPTSKSMWVCLS